eukprot:gene1621-2852_t
MCSLCPNNVVCDLGHALCVSLATGSGAISAQPRLSLVDLQPHLGTFKLALDGDVWFENSPVWVNADNATWSADPAPGQNRLVPDPASPAHTTGIDPVWGSFNATSQAWVVNPQAPKAFVTTVRLYRDAALFIQNFSNGLNWTSSIACTENGSCGHSPSAFVSANGGGAVGVISSFPAFSPTDMGSDAPRTWMAYNGWDCANGHGCVESQAQRVALGEWGNLTTTLPDGLEGSGPIAISAGSAGPTVVISAASSFMSASQQFVTSPQHLPLPPDTPFNYTENAYCGAKRDQYQVMNITLSQCRAKCLDIGCTCFAYSPVVMPAPYYNCRVSAPGTPTITQPSTRNYTAYTRSQPPTPGILTYGLMGTVTSVPPGHTVGFIMAVGRGPNHAVRSWGARLSAQYGKAPLEGSDFTTANLGYVCSLQLCACWPCPLYNTYIAHKKQDTDNGAYYYYNPEPGKTYDQTLLDVQAYARSEGIPYRHVQLDSWWYIKGHGNGVKDWSPAPNTFPQGLGQFHAATGWRITAHNRMWSSDNVYDKRNGGNYTFLDDGVVAMPLEQRFWNDTMSAGKDWGLYVYEQDWLFTEFIGMDQMLSSAMLATDWLRQMATGAAN